MEKVIIENNDVTSLGSEIEKPNIEEMTPKQIHEYYMPFEATGRLPAITRIGKIVDVVGDQECRIACIEFMGIFVFMFDEEMPDELKDLPKKSLIGQNIRFKPIKYYDNKILVSYKEIYRYYEKAINSSKIFYGKIIRVDTYQHDKNKHYVIVRRKGDNIIVPYSELVMPLPKDIDQLVDQIVGFIVIGVDKRNRLIGSIKAVYDFHLEQLKYLFKTGESVTAVVEKLMKFGAILKYKHDIPLIMRNKDYSLDYTSCQDVLSVGDKVKIKFVEESPYNHNIFVSPQEKYITPKEIQIEGLEEGQRYEGKVVGLSSFGCFVKIGPGQDVLCPISYNQRDPKIGDKVEVEISVINPSTRRLKGKIIGFYDELLDLSEYELI